MRYHSPAKLNLFFRVLYRRSDGYHQIASLFQAIDLFDYLSIEPAPRDCFTSSDPTLALDESNLDIKALHLFRSHIPTPPLRIHLEKIIPIQAGLGGGSSNAATTLFALNNLLGRPVPLPQLIEWGAQLGSDVAFFLSLGTAYCTGRGELLHPFSLPEPLQGYLAKPSYGLSTPLVYQATRPTEFLQRDPLEALHSYPTFFNDLETPSFELEPRLSLLKSELLSQGFSSVTMTGSGTAFFCIGAVQPKPIDGVRFYPFRSITRSANSWY